MVCNKNVGKLREKPNHPCLKYCGNNPTAFNVSHNHPAIVLLEIDVDVELRETSYCIQVFTENSLVAFKYDFKHFKGHGVMS